jgi:hypothetical protein
MSNRSINVLASMTLVFLPGFCSQEFPVNDHVRCSVSPGERCGLEDESQVAALDDDFDEASDDVVLLHCISIWSLSGATFPFSLGCETITGSLYLRASATLESQHVPLRL